MLQTLPQLQTMPLAAVMAAFDALNHNTSHYQSSNDICTPMGCVKEMVDRLPPEVWRRPGLRVLDACCGNGNFHAYIGTKAPPDALHFNDINDKRIANVRKMFGDSVNITEQDFLTMRPAGLFDIVVANPPYAKFCEGGKRASKNHNLSRAFIKKGLEMTKDGGYIAFIVPDNWMSYSDRNILPGLMSQYQFHHLNIHGAKRWFPGVGSSFTWFILQKTPNTRAFKVDNFYKRTETTMARLDEGADFIPLFYNNTVRGLMQKTIYAKGEKYAVETTSDLHRYTKRDLLNDTESAKHPHRLIHTPRQTVWSSRPHKYQKGWKVFLSLSDRYGAFVDDCGMTQSIAFVRCKSKREAERISGELSNPIYRAINNLTRYGNFNNIRILQRLPLLPSIRLTRKEEELVNFFAGVL